METIEMNFNYLGADIFISIQPEENLLGTLYPVEINEQYSFTVFLNEEEDWDIMREADATTPFIEPELFDLLIKKLQYQLRYAA